MHHVLVKPTELRLRVKDRITAWRVVVEHMAETESSVLVFGRRDDQPVVVKVVKRVGDEWQSGAVLQAFEGNGVVRVFDYTDGALLLERLSPGNSLVSMALTGNDEQATESGAHALAPEGTDARKRYCCRA
jgi:streptomycin 6-kinase